MTPPTHPDWLARSLAVGALVVSVAVGYAGRTDVWWGRRAKNIDDLRVPLQQLRSALEAATLEVQQTRLLLWSARHAATIEMIEDRLDVLADRKLRRLLRRLREQCVALRGQAPDRFESYEQSLPPDLTAASQLLPKAIASVDQALARLHKITKRAPA